MNSLVVGYGSIGRRHEEVLRLMGSKTAVVSRHANSAPCSCFRSLQDGLGAFDPQYIVVANRTSEHLQTLEEIGRLGFKGTCLVEKPLASCPLPGGWNPEFDVYIGYVMRFHPLLQQASEILNDKKVLSLHAYVGQYLPDWRPEDDYRRCYSAKRDEGGGVLRDLSHELDYLSVLAGSWRRVAALGGHLSELQIDSDDVYGLLLELEHCPVALCQMNYLDRNVRRDCTIQYEGGSLYLDFVAQRMVHNGVSNEVPLSRNDMFRAMHASVWNGEPDLLCSWQEGGQLLELIDAAEESARRKGWVCRTSR